VTCPGLEVRIAASGRVAHTLLKKSEWIKACISLVEALGLRHQSFQTATAVGEDTACTLVTSHQRQRCGKKDENRGQTHHCWTVGLMVAPTGRPRLLETCDKEREKIRCIVERAARRSTNQQVDSFEERSLTLPCGPSPHRPLQMTVESVLSTRGIGTSSNSPDHFFPSRQNSNPDQCLLRPLGWFCIGRKVHLERLT